MTKTRKEPKPLREGYGAAYRMKLHDEFLGSYQNSLGKQPPWVREAMSRMFKEIENHRAALNAALAELSDIESNSRTVKEARERARLALESLREKSGNEI